MSASTEKSKQKVKALAYKRVAEMMDGIYSDFMDGVSTRRLARKYSQPQRIVEFVLWVKMLRGSRR